MVFFVMHKCANVNTIKEYSNDIKAYNNDYFKFVTSALYIVRLLFMQYYVDHR